MGIGLCEAHAVESMVRRSLPPGSQFAHPAMTLFLQKFDGYMMAFGISYDQGRNSVAATLRKHEAMLTANGKAAYTQLLLQAYETAAQSSSQTVPRTLDETGSSPAVASGGSTNAETDPSGNGGASAVATEDDFEAVSLGLTGSASQPADQ